MLRRSGVVGDPAGHSLSPAIHRAGYAAVGLDWDYQAYTVATEEFGGFVRARLHDPEWVGLSVTAPHKEAVVSFGEPDEPTRLLGVGNTIVFGDNPTVHNMLAIRRALMVAAKRYVSQDGISAELERAVGRVVRAFDPCIACATK